MEAKLLVKILGIILILQLIILLFITGIINKLNMAEIQQQTTEKLIINLGSRYAQRCCSK